MTPNHSGRARAAFRVAALALLASSGLSGCSLLAPFDSEFQCERSRDFGRCTDVAGAYKDALGSTIDAPSAEQSSGKAEKGKSDSADAARTREDEALARNSVNRYKAAEYREMAGLIDQPITPVVTPPKVVRTLMVAYATPEKALFLPRYVYYFVSEGNFVMGDYLNAERPDEASTVYPNGQFNSFR